MEETTQVITSYGHPPTKDALHQDLATSYLHLINYTLQVLVKFASAKFQKIYVIEDITYWEFKDF